MDIDLSKFTSETRDILERLYKDTEIVHYSIDDYLNLPVNDEYKKNQEKKKKLEKEKKLTDEKSQWF